MWAILLQLSVSYRDSSPSSLSRWFLHSSLSVSHPNSSVHRIVLSNIFLVLFFPVNPVPASVILGSGRLMKQRKSPDLKFACLTGLSGLFIHQARDVDRCCVQSLSFHRFIALSHAAHCLFLALSTQHLALQWSRSHQSSGIITRIICENPLPPEPA